LYSEFPPTVLVVFFFPKKKHCPHSLAVFFFSSTCPLSASCGASQIRPFSAAAASALPYPFSLPFKNTVLGALARPLSHTVIRVRWLYCGTRSHCALFCFFVLGCSGVVAFQGGFLRSQLIAVAVFSFSAAKGIPYSAVSSGGETVPVSFLS